MRPAVFEPVAFADHELLDSGEGEKLERFGAVLLRRPDPQALWRRRLAAERWEAADLAFERESDRGGAWRPGARAPAHLRGPAASWPCRFDDARFLLRPTPFKHVGLFPEQAPNWRLVQRLAGAFDARPPRLLNLFGYTGAASVLAARAGYEVTHVDASKLAIGWTLENAAASGLARDALRVLVDDALAFARREARRGARYEVVLVDPPHHGRGPKGERWQLESGLAPLVEALRAIAAERALLVLSTYAVGHSPLTLANLLDDGEGSVEAGELALAESGSERLLPAGFCARWWRGLEAPGGGPP